MNEDGAGSDSSASETQAGDISACPTNVISITDGQIFLSRLVLSRHSPSSQPVYQFRVGGFRATLDLSAET